VARKASQALAALHGVAVVGQPEVDSVIDMVLSHRVKGTLGSRPTLSAAGGQLQ
jgi:hypothetical protein